MVKILITGGAGFIGSSVSDKLLALGNSVMVIDNYETGSRSNNAPHKNLLVNEGNIADYEFLEKAFIGFMPEVVLHAAASFDDPDNWERDVKTNINGTLNVIRCAKLVSTSKIVYLQTSLCYGLTPIENPITLNHPLFGGKFSGGSSYAITKTVAEQYLGISGIRFISLRLANIYGPRNLSGPLPAFFQGLSNIKECTITNTLRDFTYIDDVVRLVVKAIEGEKFGYYNVASGTSCSVKELFVLTARSLGVKRAPFIEKNMGEDDVATLSLDPSKTELDFNWKAETSLERGVTKTVEWYRGNPPVRIYTHLKRGN
jgi:UDP-glucose 4-epimerase